MPKTEETPDLHGYERLPLESYDQEITLVERVTLPDREEAIRWLADELGLDAEDLNPEPIFMRWEQAPPGEPFKNLDGFEFDDRWVPCEEDHPDAVPFWKEAP